MSGLRAGPVAADTAVYGFSSARRGALAVALHIGRVEVDMGERRKCTCGRLGARVLACSIWGG